MPRDRLNIKKENSRGRYRTDSPPDRSGANSERDAIVRAVKDASAGNARHPGSRSGAGVSMGHGKYESIQQSILAATQQVNMTVTSSPPPPASAVQQFNGLEKQPAFDFAVGEVYGIRAWRVDMYGRLKALHISSAPAWRPGVNVAKCLTNGYYGGMMRNSFYDYAPPDPSHQAPDDRCKCGFYAYTDPRHEEVVDYSGSEHVVIGIVRGTGRTLIGSQGFRSEKAEIVALLDPTRHDSDAGVWVANRKVQRDQIRRAYPEIPLLGDRDALTNYADISPMLPDPSSELFWEMP